MMTRIVHRLIQRPKRFDESSRSPDSTGLKSLPKEGSSFAWQNIRNRAERMFSEHQFSTLAIYSALGIMCSCGPAVDSPGDNVPPSLLINGQSNALASVLMLKTDKNIPHLPNGIEGQDLLSWDGDALVQADGNGVGKGQYIGPEIGLWAAHLGRQLLDDAGGELVIINRAVGGRSISYFLPGKGNYELMRDHVQAAGLEPKAYVWSQGENDGASGEATSSDEYLARLCELHGAVLGDYPTIGRFVVVGTSSATCGGDSSEVRDAQQRFADAHADVVLVDVDDMTGDPLYHTGCHYTYTPGYTTWADRIQEALQ